MAGLFLSRRPPEGDKTDLFWWAVSNADEYMGTGAALEQGILIYMTASEILSDYCMQA